jgi:hypothetical protein
MNCKQVKTSKKDLELINFAKWLGDNHFRLVNVSNDIYYWKSEINDVINLTTKSLVNIYKLEQKLK